MGAEFCIGNVRCDIDGEYSHRIMSLTKICIGNIGEQIQYWEYWDWWGDIGEVCCVLKNTYQILGTRFSNGHVEMSGAILVNRVI